MEIHFYDKSEIDTPWRHRLLGLGMQVVVPDHPIIATPYYLDRYPIKKVNWKIYIAVFRKRRRNAGIK